MTPGNFLTYSVVRNLRLRRIAHRHVRVSLNSLLSHAGFGPVGKGCPLFEASTLYHFKGLVCPTLQQIDVHLQLIDGSALLTARH